MMGMDNLKWYKSSIREEHRHQAKWLEVTPVVDLTASLEADSTRRNLVPTRVDSLWEPYSEVTLSDPKTIMLEPITTQTKTNYS